MATKVTSCGVLVLSSTGELLLGHATGSRRWDIFKGLPEGGETPLQTALRELDEESSLVPEPASLVDLGVFSYLPRKDLHLFAMRRNGIATASLHCRSTFIDRFGRTRPELDAFEWVPLESIPARCGRGLTRVLTSVLPLRVVSQQARFVWRGK